MVVRKYGLYAAWLVVTLGMMFSLYYSVIKNIEPCHLCWYQRIALFPLFIILGIATFRGYTGIIPYVLPQVFFGFLAALYQIFIQEIPGWNPINMCGSGPSCSEKITILGPISIPMLSAFGFCVIAALLIAAWQTERSYRLNRA